MDHFASWSLGKGWRTGFDSRIIFGSKFQAAKEYDELKQITDEMQAKIDEIQYHPDKAALQQQLNDLKAFLPGLATAKAKALAAEEKNKFIINQTDEEAKKEQWIGNDLIKWIDTRGTVYTFRIQDNNTIIPEDKHSNRFSILNNGQYRVIGEDNIEYLYSSKGFLISTTDRQGNTISYHRNSNNRLEYVNGPFSRTFNLTWNSNGLLTKVVDPANGSVHYYYDNQKRLIKVIDVAGLETHFSYSYSVNNKAITKIIESSGHETKYAYKSIEHDQLGSKSVLDYIIDPLGEKWSYQFDTQTYNTTQTDRNNQTTNIEINDEFLVSKITHPDGTSSYWEYDSNEGVMKGS